MTEKENILRVHRHEIPEWIPQNFAATQLFSPSCYKSQGNPGVGGVDLFGTTWVVEDNAPTGAIPDPRIHIIPNIEDIAHWRDYLTLPNIDEMDWAGAAERDLAQMDRENKVIATNILDGNFNRLQAIMGTCEALVAMMEEEEAVLDFFDYHTNLKIKMLDKVAHYYKPDIIINGDDVCSSSGLFFNRSMYEKFIKPFEKRYAEAILEHDITVQHHVCGKCEEIIPDIVETGATVIETMQPFMNDINKMKELYGDKVIFDGGWDPYGPHNNYDATEEMIRSESRRCVDEYAQDGLFIIYGGPMIPASYGWDLFWKLNGIAFEESKEYSRKMIKKKFG